MGKEMGNTCFRASILRAGELSEQSIVECELQDLKHKSEQLETDFSFTQEERGHLILVVN